MRDYDPGPDRTAFTDDDVLQYISTWADDPEQPYWYYLGHTVGPDGILDTPDDGYGGYTKYTYDADGLPSGLLIATDSGPDGVPFNDDDTIELHSIIGATHSFLLEEPGDQLVDTSDLVRDAYGRVIQQLLLGVGPDGIAGTADDTIVDAYANDYDPTTGLQSAWRASYRPGPDGLWLTADDGISHDERYTYDVNGNLLQAADHPEQHAAVDIVYYAPITQ
jgi:hypothetical protein